MDWPQKHYSIKSKRENQNTKVQIPDFFIWFLASTSKSLSTYQPFNPPFACFFKNNNKENPYFAAVT